MLLLFCALLTFNMVNSQNLEIEGKATVTDLPTDNAAGKVVVLLSDGSLGTRDVSSLGGGEPFIVGGGSANNGFDDGTNNFMSMGSGTIRTGDFSTSRTRSPMSGRFSKFEAAINLATSGTDYTFTLYVNGAPKSLTCKINVGNLSCTDLTNSVVICEGDEVAVLYTGDDADDMVNDNRHGRWIALFTPQLCE